jgi:hypothetical protein
MNNTTHPVWILQAFDRAGNVIGTITKHPNLPVVREGDPGAFALLDTRDLDNPDNYSGPPPCPKCGQTFHKDADNHPVPCPLGDTLRAIGARLRKQDNRCTANPMYCVQIKVRENGFDTGYTDNKCWHHPAAEVTVYDDDPDFVQRVMDAEKAAADEWDISGYRDRWETVMAAFTENGCRAMDGNLPVL